MGDPYYGDAGDLYRRTMSQVHPILLQDWGLQFKESNFRAFRFPACADRVIYWAPLALAPRMTWELPRGGYEVNHLQAGSDHRPVSVEAILRIAPMVEGGAAFSFINGFGDSLALASCGAPSSGLLSEVCQSDGDDSEPEHRRNFHRFSSSVSTLEPPAQGQVHLSEEEAARTVQREFRAANERLRQNGARIVIMGAAGAGKTSLLSRAFGDEVGLAGCARPAAQSVGHLEPTEACPLHIYDAKGFDTVSSNDEIVDDLWRLNRERKLAAAAHPPGSEEALAERIHAVWWVTAGRLEPKLQSRVREVFDGVPIFIVVNCCDQDQDKVREVVQSVEADCRWAHCVLPASADPERGPMGKVCEDCASPGIHVDCRKRLYSCQNRECARFHKETPWRRTYGVAELIDLTIRELPEPAATALALAQRQSLWAMDRAATAAVATYTASAGGIGWNPMPFSDWPLLIAHQTAMAATLAKIYQVKLRPGTFRALWSSLGVVGIFSATGKLVGSLLKMIPGFGTVAGGVSDSTIAASMTAAMGGLLRELLRRARGAGRAANVGTEDFAQVMPVQEQRETFQRLLAAALEVFRASPDAAASDLPPLLPRAPPPIRPLHAVVKGSATVRWSHGEPPADLVLLVGGRRCAGGDEAGTFVVPRHDGEPMRVGVATRIGAEELDYPEAFSWVGEACVEDVLPRSGPLGATGEPQAVCVATSDLGAQIIRVRIGGQECRLAPGAPASSTRVEVFLPPGARPGRVDVEVVAANGAMAVLRNGFEYYVPVSFACVGRNIDLAPGGRTASRVEGVYEAVCVGAAPMELSAGARCYYELLVDDVTMGASPQARSASSRALAVGFTTTAAVQRCSTGGHLDVREARELPEVWLCGYESRGALAISRSGALEDTQPLPGWQPATEIYEGSRIGVLAMQPCDGGAPQLVIFAQGAEVATVAMAGVPPDCGGLLPVVDLQGRVVRASLLQRPQIPALGW